MNYSPGLVLIRKIKGWRTGGRNVSRKSLCVTHLNFQHLSSISLSSSSSPLLCWIATRGPEKRRVMNDHNLCLSPSRRQNTPNPLCRVSLSSSGSFSARNKMPILSQGHKFLPLTTLMKPNAAVCSFLSTATSLGVLAMICRHSKNASLLLASRKNTRLFFANRVVCSDWI